MNSKTPKLTIELIPKTCHYSNVRTMVTTKEWDKIRFIAYEKAKHKCQICNEIGKNQGFRHNLECHEIWEYNEKTLTQKLSGVIALCPLCHQVKHIGRAIAMGRGTKTYEHMAKVNKWTLNEIQQHVDEAFLEYNLRSKHEWELDITLLKNKPFLINIKIGKKRKFKTNTYKKKRKKPTTKKVVLNVRKPKKHQN
jgi:5-methylcytosine-specific restriction endonuclease McrA